MLPCQGAGRSSRWAASASETAQLCPMNKYHLGPYGAIATRLYDACRYRRGFEDVGASPAWLQVYAGGRVDNALISAFSRVAASGGVQGNDGAEGSAEVAVARRCSQLLATMPTPLLLDLVTLFQDAIEQGEQRRAAQAAKNLQHVSAQFRQHGVGLSGAAAALGCSASPSPPVPEAETVEGLVAGLRKLAAQCPTALLAAPLTPNQRLIVTFRAAKKLVLWSVVHSVLAKGSGLGASSKVAGLKLGMPGRRSEG